MADHFRSRLAGARRSGVGGAIVHDDDSGEKLANFTDELADGARLVQAGDHRDAMDRPVHEGRIWGVAWLAKEIVRERTAPSGAYLSF